MFEFFRVCMKHFGEESTERMQRTFEAMIGVGAKRQNNILTSRSRRKGRYKMGERSPQKRHHQKKLLHPPFDRHKEFPSPFAILERRGMRGGF